MEEKILNQICNLLGENIGYLISEQYREFYKTKTDEIILLSAESLLTELIGPNAAQNQLFEIKNHLSLNKETN